MVRADLGHLLDADRAPIVGRGFARDRARTDGDRGGGRLAGVAHRFQHVFAGDACRRGPLPWTIRRSTPTSRAKRRTAGLAAMPAPAAVLPAGGVAGLAGGSWETNIAASADGRVRRRRRLAADGACGAGAGRLRFGCGLAGRRLGGRSCRRGRRRRLGCRRRRLGRRSRGFEPAADSSVISTCAHGDAFGPAWT